MLQFINPGAWWLAGLFAILIALYLWQRTRRQLDVPSLLLWRTIPASAARASRFQPDWLFVLQCALLALLIAGLADPYLDDRPGAAAPTRTVFVLDLSASMQAREGRQTRFDLARATLRARVTALGSDDEALLIAAAHQPQIAVPFTRDHAALLRRLAELTPVDTAAPLDV
ncbi:MAG: vWA domain-containing protein, partial [Candidatus Binatia bacterium]